MLIRAFTFLCIALLSAAAKAQQTTTTCSGSSVSVICNSTTTPSLGDIFTEDAKAREAKDAKRAESLDARTSTVERFAARQRQLRLTAEIGQMISGGRCGEALKEALSSGDLDLAIKTKQLCEGK